MIAGLLSLPSPSTAGDVSSTLVPRLSISPSPSTAANVLTVTDVSREVGLAASGLYLNYREFNPTEVDSNIGWTPGFGAKASYMWNIGNFDSVFASVNYQFARGNVTQSDYSKTGSVTNAYVSGLMINDVVLEVGKGFLVSKNLIFIPVTQVEYRNWLRMISESILSPQEDYSFFAPGVGLRATYGVAPRLALTAKVDLEYTISPIVSVSANPPYDVPGESERLGSRPVPQFQLGVDYLFVANLHGYASLSYSHFEFGQSRTVIFPNPIYFGGAFHTGEFEPNSITNQIYLQIGLAWSL
jgi:hypothetical protein